MGAGRYNCGTVSVRPFNLFFIAFIVLFILAIEHGLYFNYRGGGVARHTFTRSDPTVTGDFWNKPPIFDFDFFDFNLPWRFGVSAAQLKRSSWFQSLMGITSKMDPNEPVLIVCSDITFRELLLNWLVSALVKQKQPPRNILVVTNGPKVCSFLRLHEVKVECLMVPISNILNYNSLKKVDSSHFNQLLVIRLALMRILNYMGYHVMNIDTDAIMLKNPIPILEQYRDSDIIGTYGGEFPQRLFKKWGLVLCMGAIVIRSTPATEQLWEMMKYYNQGKNLYDVFDDQFLFNTALNKIGIKWRKASVSSTDPKYYTSWEGHALRSLKISLLPLGKACRTANSCVKERQEGMYIWHSGKLFQHKSKDAISIAKEDGVWFLRNDWQNVTDEGNITWLTKISQFNVS